MGAARLVGVRKAAQASINGVSRAFGCILKSLFSMATPAIEYSAMLRISRLEVTNSLSAINCVIGQKQFWLATCLAILRDKVSSMPCACGGLMRCFTNPSFEDREDGHPGIGQNQMVLYRA